MSTTETDTLQYTIEGRPDGDTIVFIHGWPDNPTVWRNQVAKFGVNYRCVLLTLPNFGDVTDSARGYDFPKLVELVANTIRAVQSHPDERVVLMTHDWGAYIGYLYEQAHPEQVRKMIALDIGGHMKQTTLKASVMIIGYQWALIAAWLAGRLVPRLGDWMSRQVARVIRVPGPRLAKVRSRYNYLYYYFWRSLLAPWAKQSLLNRYRPKSPVLYLYGVSKPVMFHTEFWLEIVKDSGGEVHPIEQAGHWLMETHADQVNEVVSKWLTS